MAISCTLGSYSVLNDKILQYPPPLTEKKKKGMEATIHISLFPGSHPAALNLWSYSLNMALFRKPFSDRSYHPSFQPFLQNFHSLNCSMFRKSRLIFENKMRSLFMNNLTALEVSTELALF